MIKIKGELEIDERRGVIYFHDETTGETALRICNLPAPIPNPRVYGALDFTSVSVMANWRGEPKLNLIKWGKLQGAEEEESCKKTVVEVVKRLDQLDKVLQSIAEGTYDLRDGKFVIDGTQTGRTTVRDMTAEHNEVHRSGKVGEEEEI